MKHQHLLHMNQNLAEIFQNPPILALCRNKNLRDSIGTKLIETSKVKRRSTNNIQAKCTPCLAKNRTLFCKQVANTTTFRSNQTNRIFCIYHKLNCKSKYEIYLLKCAKCKKKYLGKTENEFSIRLNNHRKDIWKPNASFQTKTITSVHKRNSF